MGGFYGWMITGIAGLVCLVLVVLGIRFLHRFLIRLEEHGYIYYREKPEGGSGGATLFELDKLTRPSVEHVQQAMDTKVQTDENDGE